MFKKFSPISKEAKARDKKVGNAIRKQHKKGKGLIKILLLGSGESGKTTVFKQMCMLKGQGFTDEYFRAMKSKLCGNVVDGTWNVLKSAERLGTTLDDDIQKAAARVVELRDQYFNEQKELITEDKVVRVEKATVPLSFISPELAESMKVLWNNQRFREAYHAAAREGRSDLADSYPNLMDLMCDKYPEWGGEKWIPSKEDILLVRVRTTGMSEEIMTVNGVRIKLIDVGGQRAERRKWLHLFQGVHSIIYVVSLSEYDQTLFEDVNVYRLEESISLFKDLAKKEFLLESALVLFLNKFDLFLQKYVNRKIPINFTGKFPDAPKVEEEEDQETCEKAIEWFKHQYTSSFAGSKRLVYSHVTTALDGEQMKFVLNATTKHILELSIQEAGFLS